MTDAQEQKAKRIAIAVSAGIATILVAQAVITGEPILQDGCHGASKQACAAQNTKAGYAHRGETTGPYDDLQNQL